MLALAPNGAYKSKDDHQHLPISDDEIITLTNDVLDLGVAMLHLHIRDNLGKHSIDANHYKKLLAKLPKNIVLQPTSEAANIFRVEQQVSMIQTLQPQFVSLALREITRLKHQALQDFFAWMNSYNVNPQIIIYTQDDADNYARLMQNNSLHARDFPILVVVGKGENDFKNIEQIIATINKWTTSIMLCGFAELEHKMIPFALENGYHLRIGFENNLHNKNGDKAKDNTQRIQEVLQSITTLTDYQSATTLLTPNWL